jgi:hypothetical protein
VDREFESPFEGPTTSYDGDRLLFRSPNCTVRGWWAAVALEGRSLDGPVTIGDFYGNPVAAAIDTLERWCVMVGCGFIAYRLGEPWQPYDYRTTSSQWFERFRGRDETRWFQSVRVEPDQTFHIVEAPVNGCVREYLVHPDQGHLELVVDPIHVRQAGLLETRGC